jgi:sugar-specific transcriptional regulator TrmB
MQLVNIKENLKELGFNSNEVKVYIALTQLGEGTAALVAKKAGLPRTTVISLLDRLGSQNYITTHIYKGKTYYWIESPRVIENAFQKKLEIAASLNAELAGMYRSEAHFPHVKIFDTRAAVRSFIEKFLLNLEKNSVIHTIDSPKEGNYAQVFLEDVFEMMLKEKRQKGILTRSLVPHGSFGGIEKFKLRNQAIKIREMPESIDFETSLWITESMIVHFSGNPVFLVLVEHDLICKSIKSLYDFLWSVSTPMN